MCFYSRIFSQKVTAYPAGYINCDHIPGALFVYSIYHIGSISAQRSAYTGTAYAVKQDIRTVNFRTGFAFIFRPKHHRYTEPCHNVKVNRCSFVYFFCITTHDSNFICRLEEGLAGHYQCISPVITTSGKKYH
jgi:hypothetical protein